MGLRTFVKAMLLRKGIVLSRPPGQFYIPHVKLAGAARRGLDVRTAVDGGAASGEYARMLRGIWPGVRLLCVEPREDVQGQLLALRGRMGNMEVARVLLGDRQGEAEFFLDPVHRDSSSMYADAAGPGAVRSTLPITTLDALVETLGFPPPDLIKLDLQGAELPALEGAPRCLAAAKSVILEASFIELEPGTVQIADLFAYMKSRGFVPYDILGMWHRPFDGALAQCDVLFVREDSPLRAEKRYWGE